VTERTVPLAIASGEAERIVHAAMASLPFLSVLFVDQQLRYRAVSGAASRRHGYDPSDLPGRLVRDVVPPPALPAIERSLRRALAGETFVEITDAADGKGVYETTYGPALDGGAIIGALVVVRDVTVEHRALAELTAADEHHQMIVGNISDVVALTTLEGRFTWVSPSSTTVLGWPPDELVGRTVFEIVHPDDLAAFRVRRAALFEDGAPALVSHRFRRPDGDSTWVESHVRPVREEGTGAVGGAVVTIRDVTARIALEAELAQASELFELSFAAAPIGMALVDPDGRFLKVNTTLCALLGRDEPALLATTFQDITHPDDLDADVDLLRQTADGRRDGYRLEKRYRLPDGSVVWALLAVSVVRDDAGDPRFYISQVEDITERKRALEDMERLATTDPLTGLPNRLLLMDRLRHALTLTRRGGRVVGVVFVDLDHFKSVNDTLGHDAGDELLRQTAERLTRAVRPGDTVTRLGGDEFVIVCEDAGGVEEVVRLAERLRATLSRPFVVYGHDLQVSASIGVTAGTASTAETLLREADRSMYAAKRNRTGQVDVYAEALEVLAHDKLSLHSELAAGIDRGELTVHYQPIVNLRTGETVAREALVRWAHPTRGLLTPAAFLDGIDRSRLGIRLGEHVLRRACTEAATWPGDIAVHVNVSARHLAQPGFAVFVSRCLARSGLTPDRLTLEITESLVLAASPSTLTSAAELTSLGIGLSLDDFGTGYSSVAALNRLPIDSFKIDRSFVADAADDPTSTALVEGLIGLGSHMDLDVIAEGIETQEQADWLISRGCPFGQGYHFGRPTRSPADGHAP
jgi:diguanylate cyclase (GGDEF)-like protein/PAS domain S-box-containing protein